MVRKHFLSNEFNKKRSNSYHKLGSNRSVQLLLRYHRYQWEPWPANQRHTFSYCEPWKKNWKDSKCPTAIFQKTLYRQKSLGLLLVPFASYGSVLRLPPIGYLAIIGSVVRKTVSWNFTENNSNPFYQHKLLKLDFQPLSLNHELRVGCPTVLKDSIRRSWHWLAKWCDHHWLWKSTNANDPKFCMPAYATQKTRFRLLLSFRQAKISKNYFEYDIRRDRGHENKLLLLYKQFFRLRYDESGPCKWHLLSNCCKCWDIRKVNFISWTTLLNSNSTVFNFYPTFYVKKFISFILLLVDRITPFHLLVTQTTPCFFPL